MLIYYGPHKLTMIYITFFFSILSDNKSCSSYRTISSSTGLPNNIAFLMLMFFHKLVPIHFVNAVFVNSMKGDYVRLNLSEVFLHKNLFPNLK